MPYLGKKLVNPIKPLVSVDPSEKIYTIKHTGEQFRSKEEYQERLDLYNQPIWTCRCTGHIGLTYQLARQSELDAYRQLESFPEQFKKPLLEVVHHSTFNLDVLVDHAYEKLGSYLFPGDIVQFKTLRDGSPIRAKVLKLEDGKYENNIPRLIHEKENVNIAHGSATNDESPKKVPPKLLPLMYTVMLQEEGTSINGVPATDLTRCERPPNKDMIRLYIKGNALRAGSQQNSPWVVEPPLVREYSLPGRFADFFVSPEKLKEAAKQAALDKKRKTSSGNADQHGSKKKKTNAENTQNLNAYSKVPPGKKGLTTPTKKVDSKNGKHSVLNNNKSPVKPSTPLSTVMSISNNLMPLKEISSSQLDHSYSSPTSKKGINKLLKKSSPDSKRSPSKSPTSVKKLEKSPKSEKKVAKLMESKEKKQKELKYNIKSGSPTKDGKKQGVGNSESSEKSQKKKKDGEVKKRKRADSTKGNDKKKLKKDGSPKNVSKSPKKESSQGKSPKKAHSSPKKSPTSNKSSTPKKSSPKNSLSPSKKKSTSSKKMAVNSKNLAKKSSVKNSRKSPEKKSVTGSPKKKMKQMTLLEMSAKKRASSSSGSPKKQVPQSPRKRLLPLPSFMKPLTELVTRKTPPLTEVEKKSVLRQINKALKVLTPAHYPSVHPVLQERLKKRAETLEYHKKLKSMTPEERKKLLREKRHLRQQKERLEKIEQEKKFEDQEIKDLVPLPPPKLVVTPDGIPNELFGDVSMICEFLNSYKGLLLTDEKCPVHPELLMNALILGDAGFAYVSWVMSILLHALLQDQATQKMREMGVPLPNIVMNQYTSPEMLRLVLRKDSGEDDQSEDSDNMDDDQHREVPEELLDKLETMELYELDASEKLKLLVGLCHKLMASDTIQNYMDSLAKKHSKVWNEHAQLERELNKEKKKEKEKKKGKKR